MTASVPPPAPEDVPDVFVGTIGRAHGIRGEVLVRPDSDNPDRFAVGSSVFTRGADGRELVIRGSRVHTKGGRIVAFEGVADRSEAEALRGTELFIPRSARRPLEAGEFWPEDLEGLEVRVGSEVRGLVVGVNMDAAQTRLRVQLLDGATAEVPFVEALVPIVDTASGYLEVVEMDGLLSEIPD